MEYTKTNRKSDSHITAERNGGQSPQSSTGGKKQREISFTYDVFVDNPNPKLLGFFVRRRLVGISYSAGSASDLDSALQGAGSRGNDASKRASRTSVSDSGRYAAPLRYFRIQDGDFPEAIARAEAFVRSFVKAGQDSS